MASNELMFSAHYLNAWDAHMRGDATKKATYLIFALKYCTDENKGHRKVENLINTPLGTNPTEVY